MSILGTNSIISVENSVVSADRDSRGNIVKTKVITETTALVMIHASAETLTQGGSTIRSDASITLPLTTTTHIDCDSIVTISGVRYTVDGDPVKTVPPSGFSFVKGGMTVQLVRDER